MFAGSQLRPLILHNVPDDELYTGEDGIQRPYAMIFPEYADPDPNTTITTNMERGRWQERRSFDSLQVRIRGDRSQNASRTRRPIAESGSFGKSSRRARSRTGSLPPKREDATMQSADKIFSEYIASQEKPTTSSNNTGYMSQSAAADDTTATSQPSRYVREPTEVILRGYRSAMQQYAVINHFEQLAGRICEDYPREPPIEQRRYKSELRDPAYTRRQPLTPEESRKVNQVAGGEHWIKVTFESAEAADAAIYSSPQKILGHLVYAEPYHNAPPKDDAAVLDMEGNVGMVQNSQPTRSQFHRSGRRQSGHLRHPSFPLSRGGPTAIDLDQMNGSPQGSQTSTQTLDTATLSTDTGTASTATVTGASIKSPLHPPTDQSKDGMYCRRIPVAKRAKLLPAEQALLPQPGVFSRVVSRIPLIKWFSGSMIGDEVPRTQSGEFDFKRASLYWQVMFYLDFWFGLFGHEIVNADKED